MNQRRQVAREVKRAKNEWFQQKARDVERGMRGGRGVWKGLREIQRGRAGLRSVKTRAVKDRDGELCIGQDNTVRRWHEYFESVLNINSSFDESVICSAQQHPLRNELMVPPTEEEIIAALGRMQINKATGKNGILPEMVNGCGGEMLEHFIDLFSTVWKEESVPTEW